MTAAELLAELKKLGVLLICDGDALRIKAPAGVLTPELKAALAEHKAALLAQLTAGAGPTPAAQTGAALAASSQSGANEVAALPAPPTADPHVARQVAALPAPQLNQPVRIPLDCLSDYLAAHHLKVVGGDPGLGRRPWRPRLYLAERADAKPEEN